MKNLKTALITSALTFAAVAYADDTTTTESKTETTHGAKKSSTKSETMTKSDPGGMGNSTTDSMKTEKSNAALDHGKSEVTKETTSTHDAPGTKHDKKVTSKSKVVKDANGNVIEGSKTETVK